MEQQSGMRAIVALIGLVMRHAVLVLAVAAAAVAGILYRMRHDLPKYQATAVIRISDKSQNLSGGLGAGAPTRYAGIYFDPVLSQVQVLESRAVAEGVVSKLGLRLRSLPLGVWPSWLDSIVVSNDALRDTVQLTFGASTVAVRDGARSFDVAYGQPVALSGLQFVIPNKPRSLEQAQLRVNSTTEAANEVQGSLSSRPRERTDAIDVSYVATDPVAAQKIVNAAVEVFQDVSARTAKQQSTRRRQFIEQQLDKVNLMLSDAQAAYNDFRVRNRVFSSKEKFQSQQADLTSIEVRRQELVADRQMYSSILAQLDTARNSLSSGRLSALASSPGIAANALMTQLFGDLTRIQGSRDSLTSGPWARTAGDADVRRLDALVASTEGKLISAVRGQISALDFRIAAMDSLRGTVSGAMSSLPGTEAQETRLFAQVQTYQRQSERLRDQLQSAQIDEAAEAGQVEIVDLAETPGYHLGTGRTYRIAFALVLGLLLGTGIAYVLENHRPVIRRRDELEQAAAFPSLAMVPQIRALAHVGATRSLLRLLPSRQLATSANGKNGGNGQQIELVTVSDARSSGAEAYRTLRTNLLFSAAVSALRRLVVTSPGPAEGKSTTAANLAIAFAQQGQRVLLIDGDLRRSRVHKIFEETQSPGLTNVLVGGVAPSEAIRSTRVEGLMIMPSGTLPPNPAELLGSRQMQDLLGTLSTNYDLLILDTPPLLAASDAAIVSRICDGALVIVRAGATERSALLAAIQQLGTVGARVLGTVLNDPDAEVPKYARYYGYYYNNYYEYRNGNSVPA